MDRLSTSSLISSDVSSEQSNLASQFADFGRSVVHASVENPVNGVRQVVNQTGLVKLPEFDIVKDAKPSLASTAGDITGSVATFALLSAGGNRLMGNLGGKGLGGSMIRAGITGAVFDGLLKPSDENSKSFVKDRVSSAFVGASTFAGMAASAYGLDKIGIFAVPEARSLSGSIAYGAISGVGGGLAHAQANAMFKDGHLFAKPQEYGNDTLSFAAFGGAFGALGYGTEKVMSTLGNRVVDVKSDNGSVRLKLDRNGEVAQVETITPAKYTYDSEIKVVNTRMTDGHWVSSSAGRFGHDGPFFMGATSYDLSQVNRLPNGEVRVLSTEGDMRSFKPNGEFSDYPIGRRVEGEKFDYLGPNGRYVADNSQLRRYDHDGRINEFKDWNTKSLNSISYDKDGNVTYLNTWRQGGQEVNLFKSNNEWRVSTSSVNKFDESGIIGKRTNLSDSFKWNGEVKALPNDAFSIKPTAGNEFIFKPGDSTKALEAMLRAQQAAH